MLRLNVALLRDKGIGAPMFYLSKMGMGHRTAKRWVRGEIEQLNMMVLYKVCVDLNCTPNDLLVPVGGGAGLPEGHALLGLVRPEGVDVITLLRGLKAEEIEALKRGLSGEGE